MSEKISKFYQLYDYFASNYDYTQVLIKQFQAYLSEEMWLINNKAKNYNIIRISCDPTSIDKQTTNRIEQHLEYYKNAIKDNELHFLDIHINNDEYDPDENKFDHVSINIDYCNRKDILEIFPNIDKQIKIIENPEENINNIAKKIIKNKQKNLSFFKKHKTLFTKLIIFICIFIYILQFYLGSKYDDVSAAILLGAEYKTFTIGLKQYYRLITYAFLHSGIFHLFCNMYSLYFISNYMETKLGHFKYLLILFSSILFGSLTQGILTDNEICIGISAGLYGLSVGFFIEMYKLKIVNIRSLLPVIIFNLSLNFMSSIAWTAHLGGLIGGYLVYTAIEKNNLKDKIIFSLLILICVVALFIKYINPSSVTIYAGSDLKIIEILSDLNLKDIANEVLIKLSNFYNKFGG